MTVYKLTYFNIRARAEYSRLLFTLAGQEFEDNRIELQDWPALKPTTPGGKVPLLEIDGKMLQDSVAIAQFLAMEFGFYGGNNWECAKINQVTYITVDLMNAVTKIPFVKDEAEKNELIKTTKENIVQTTLRNLSDLLGSKTYFIMDKLTLADIFVFHGVDTVITILGDDVVKDFPIILKHRETFSENSSIAAYLKTRPDSFV